MLPILLAAAQFAPFLAKYLNGGSTSEKIAQGVADVAQVVTSATSPEQAIAQLQGSTELQQKFQLAVMEKQTEWDKIYLADVQNARDRDVQLAKLGFQNNRANWLVGLAIVMVFALLFVVIWKSNIDEFTKGILTFLLGRFCGYLDNIYSFDFGTTRASKQKDETIQELSKTS